MTHGAIGSAADCYSAGCRFESCWVSVKIVVGKGGGVANKSGKGWTVALAVAIVALVLCLGTWGANGFN